MEPATIEPTKTFILETVKVLLRQQVSQAAILTVIERLEALVIEGEQRYSADIAALRERLTWPK